MRTLNLSASVIVATLILAGYNANAQAPMAPATMQAPAPTQFAPPANTMAPHRIDSVGDGAIPALPLDVQNVNNITYINGGIGDEEVAELKAKEKDFNVHVLVSAPQGQFISDVTLTLIDRKDTAILTVSDAGPYFYAELPAGFYTLQASANGETKKIKLMVPKRGAVKKQITFGESGGIVSPHTPTATVD